MNSKQNISGYVLSGGRSSRIGTDKALLKFNDQTLLEHTISLLHPFCSGIWISGVNPEYTFAGLEMIADKYPEIGPIGGIYSALCQTKTDWNIFISVDVPYINGDLLNYLIKNSDDYDCVIPKHASGVEPLIAIYNKRVLPIVKLMICSGDYKLINLLSKLNARFLNCEGLIQQFPNLFFNVNRMEDYEIMLKNSLLK